MTEFTGKTIMSPEKLTVEDQAKTNTPTQVDDHGALFIAGSAEAEFRQRDQPGVIFNEGGYTNPFCYIMSNTFFPGRQKGVVDPFFSIHTTPHADADACDPSFHNLIFPYILVDLSY